MTGFCFFIFCSTSPLIFHRGLKKPFLVCRHQRPLPGSFITVYVRLLCAFILGFLCSRKTIKCPDAVARERNKIKCQHQWLSLKLSANTLLSLSVCLRVCLQSVCCPRDCVHSLLPVHPRKGHPRSGDQGAPRSGKNKHTHTETQTHTLAHNA